MGPHSSPPRSYRRNPARVQHFAAWLLLALLMRGASGRWHERGRASGQNCSVGDSLSAGFGLPAQAAFPARLAEALAAKALRPRLSMPGCQAILLPADLAVLIGRFRMAQTRSSSSRRERRIARARSRRHQGRARHNRAQTCRPSHCCLAGRNAGASQYGPGLCARLRRYLPSACVHLPGRLLSLLS